MADKESTGELIHIGMPMIFFNAFTFTDFDYEERPGSDAVSIQKYFNNGSDVEVALSINRDTAFVAATKYSWNYWNYDFQILGEYILMMLS